MMRKYEEVHSYSEQDGEVSKFSYYNLFLKEETATLHISDNSLEGFEDKLKRPLSPSQEIFKDIIDNILDNVPLMTTVLWAEVKKGEIK